MKNKIQEQVLKVLEKKKIYAKRWKGKYSMYFEEEFEMYPEVREAIGESINSAIKKTIDEVKAKVEGWRKEVETGFISIDEKYVNELLNSIDEIGGEDGKVK
jgi:uncharacterized protein YicC (UPF0701 family)